MNAAVHPSPAAARGGALRMAAGGLLLGTLGLFVEEAATDPLTLVWGRCVFGAAALAAWCAATGRLAQLRLGSRGWAAAGGAGALMAASWALFFAAIPRTSIGVATVVFHVQPLFLMLAGAWWLREPVSPLRWGAAALALGGLVLASGALAQPSADGAGYCAGLAMCLVGAACNTVVTLIAKRVPATGTLGLAWGQCMVGMLLLSAWPLQHGVPAAGPAWWWIAGLGVIHTGLAYVLLYGGIARLASARIAVLQFVYPASAIALDAVVYGRMLAPLQWLGVAVMAAALFAARDPR